MEFDQCGARPTGGRVRPDVTVAVEVSSAERVIWCTSSRSRRT